MATSQKKAEVLDFMPRYAKRPERDKDTHNPIPEPNPDVIDRSEYEYVSIPLKDVFDKKHQGASVNGIKLEAGVTYFMPPEFAAEARRILDVGQKADLRILQATPDVRGYNPSGNPAYATPSDEV